MPIKSVELPPAAELHALFNYDPEIGVLTWKERPPTTRANKTHNARDAGKPVGTLDTWGHRQVRVGGKLRLAARIIWKMMVGSDPIEQIDHINGLRDDNRWENLREATPLQNAWNHSTQVNNTSGHPCIYPIKTKRASSKKFRLYMWIGGRRTAKDFHTFEEAKAAYDFAFASFRDITFKRSSA
jgi:hypothetical protein